MYWKARQNVECSGPKNSFFILCNDRWMAVGGLTFQLPVEAFGGGPNHNYSDMRQSGWKIESQYITHSVNNKVYNGRNYLNQIFYFLIPRIQAYWPAVIEPRRRKLFLLKFNHLQWFLFPSFFLQVKCGWNVERQRLYVKNAEIFFPYDLNSETLPLSHHVSQINNKYHSNEFGIHLILAFLENRKSSFCIANDLRWFDLEWMNSLSIVFKMNLFGSVRVAKHDKIGNKILWYFQSSIGEMA